MDWPLLQRGAVSPRLNTREPECASGSFAVNGFTNIDLSFRRHRKCEQARVWHFLH